MPAQAGALLQAPPGLEGSDRVPLGEASPAPDVGSDMLGNGGVDEGRLRAVVLRDVDAHIQAKVDGLLQAGRQMMHKEQQQWKETFARVTEELSSCKERQRLLEGEQALLRGGLESLHTRLALLQQWAPATGLSGLSPATDAAEVVAGAGPSELAALAAVPPFPYPAGSAPDAPIQRLSLSEALETEVAHGRPPSSAGSPAPPSAAGTASVASPSASRDSGTFAFCLRKADGVELGLNIAQADGNGALCVEGVLEKGAVEAWNKQCLGSMQEKAIKPGDQIISVNGISEDPTAMLKECRDKQLLKLTVLRGASKAPSVLRADASVFVPGATARAADSGAELGVSGGEQAAAERI